jgi:hypothetical protein
MIAQSGPRCGHQKLKGTESERSERVSIGFVFEPSKNKSMLIPLVALVDDEAIGLAYREGSHTMSAIARELGLSVARISRLIAAREAKGKT